jgi:hypothetical protein
MKIPRVLLGFLLILLGVTIIGCSSAVETTMKDTTAVTIAIETATTTTTASVVTATPTPAVTSAPNDSGQPPALPDGGQPLAPPEGGTPPDGNTPPGGGTAPVQPGSGDTTTTTMTITGAYTLSTGTDSKSNTEFTASNKDESAVLVTSNAVLTLTECAITTSGDTSSMDNSSFYGLNAAVLAESGAEITLENCTITTTGTGANGVFATGTGSTIRLTNVTIYCTASGAHGVDATISGTLILENVDITTKGDGASAAIATDRGSGTITVIGGNVLTTGTKSPAIYSTGVITVTGGVLKATGSEAAVIEGKNSITLVDTELTAEKERGVMIYQSMSGDANVGTGNFNMTGGSLSALVGPLFYCTNTDAVINLQGVQLTAASGTLLSAKADSWGTSGSNGADVTMTLDNETAAGDISADSISTVDITLKNGTTLTGAIDSANTAKKIVLNLDSSSVWEVTADSYLTVLTDADTTLANIHSHGHNIYYDASNIANAWLNGQTITLADGGKLIPA